MKNIPRYGPNHYMEMVECEKGDWIYFNHFERYSDDIRMENIRLRSKLQRASKMIWEVKMENKRLENELEQMRPLTE